MPRITLKELAKRRDKLAAAAHALAKATKNGKTPIGLGTQAEIEMARLIKAAFVFVQASITGSDGKEFTGDAVDWLRFIRKNDSAIAKAFDVAKGKPFAIVFAPYEAK